MKRVTEGSGRYDNLHGDEDEIEAAREAADLARRDALCDEPPRTGHICCMCSCDPCESPGWCRAQARFEDDPGDAGDYVDMNEEMDLDE